MDRFDLGDEAGRTNLRNLVTNVFIKNPCEENHIKSLIKISEKLIPISDNRLQFYVDIVRESIQPAAHVDTSTSAPSRAVDSNSEVAIASLKMKLFELKEEETKCFEAKDYDKLTEIAEQIAVCNEELTNLNSFLPNESVCIKSRNIYTLLWVPSVYQQFDVYELQASHAEKLLLKLGF